MRPVYLDCAATTPLEPSVLDVSIHYLRDEFGNAGSRTHEYGARASQAVEEARRRVAHVVGAEPAEVTFTSGATEANNLALLGLAEHGERSGRRHIVSTAIEHKAVLEPLEQLAMRGFEVELVRPNQSGAVNPNEIVAAVRPDTLLISMIHVNNETGVIQPVGAVADGLPEGPYLHVDAAQSFGKELDTLRHQRIDLLTASSHKVFGPKGVGALIGRRRGWNRPPLRSLIFGGGQERGLRPGTQPVHLIAAFGEAAHLAVADASTRRNACIEMRESLLSVLERLGAQVNGDPARGVPHIVNVSFPGLDGEAAILALRDVISISNGSACTSSSYTPSHVLQSMGLSADRVRGALRLSWCHLTPELPLGDIEVALKRIL